VQDEHKVINLSGRDCGEKVTLFPHISKAFEIYRIFRKMHIIVQGGFIGQGANISGGEGAPLIRLIAKTMCLCLKGN